VKNKIGIGKIIIIATIAAIALGCSFLTTKISVSVNDNWENCSIKADSVIPYTPPCRDKTNDCDDYTPAPQPPKSEIYNSCINGYKLTIIFLILSHLYIIGTLGYFSWKVYKK